MPSNVALVLCSVLVLFMLRTGRKQMAEVSLAVWIPTLWMLYCASRPLASWKSNDLLLSVSSAGVGEGSAIDRNFLLVLMILGLVILARRRFDWRGALRNNYWLTALLLYVAVSIIWSDAPFVSIKRVIKLSGGVVMGMIILSERSPGQALEIILQRVSYILIPFSLMLVKYFPDLGVFYLPHSGERWWIGVTTTKNNLGVLCTVAALFLFWSLQMHWHRRKTPEMRWRFYLDLLVLLIALYLLQGGVSYSATSLVCLVAGFITAHGLWQLRMREKPLNISLFMVPVLVIFLFGTCAPFLGTAAFSRLASLLGRDVTFTGRTEIWAQLAPMALQDPLLGHGYGGFWLGTNYAEVNEAHNGYLEVVLGLGFVGLLFAMGFIASCCREAYWEVRRNDRLAYLGFALVVMLVLHNVTEASFAEDADLMWTSLIFTKMVNRNEMLVANRVLESEAVHLSQSAAPCPGGG